MTEHEDVAILFVFRVEGKCRDAPAHVEKEIFFTGRVIGQKAVNPAFVLGDQEAIRERVLGNENGAFERNLGEDASQTIGRRRLGGAYQARSRPERPLLESEWLLRRSSLRHRIKQGDRAQRGRG